MRAISFCRIVLIAAVATVAVAFVACSSKATTPASPTQQSPIPTATAATAATSVSVPPTSVPASPTPTPATVATPTVAATVVPTAAPTATQAAQAPTATSPGGSGLTGKLALGEELFQKTAGGVGCASCHGKEGKGDVGIGPANRGKTADEVRFQLKNNEAMSFIKLTDDEIEAVAAYLAYLATLP